MAYSPGQPESAAPQPHILIETTARLQDYQATIERCMKKITRLADHMTGPRPTEVKIDKNSADSGTVIQCLEDMHRAVVALEEQVDRFFQS